MQVTVYEHLREFSERAMPLLMENEAANNLPIGILNRGLHAQTEPAWFMACVSDAAGADLLIALMTPPHNMILVSTVKEPPVAALETLREELLRSGENVPGAIGEKALATAFAQLYCTAAGLRPGSTMNERVYRLDAVSPVPHPGTLRPATEKDLHFLPYWISDFNREALGTATPLDEPGMREAVKSGALYLLDVNAQPVCLVGSSRQMPHGRSIGPVYTPPYYRTRGYAASAVAQLSSLLLDRGNQYCALFTDLSNPISNSVYQRVGYHPLCDYAQIEFDPA